MSAEAVKSAREALDAADARVLQIERALWDAKADAVAALNAYRNVCQSYIAEASGVEFV